MTTLDRPPLANPNPPGSPPSTASASEPNWPAEAERLAAQFASRATRYDATDEFVSENYAELKAARFLSVGIPGLLGGGGASFADVCQVIRILARGCSSTALAFSMHCHLVAAAVWRWRHLQAPVGGFLSRIAREQLVLVSTGGSDWLDSSGRAEAVDGGYTIHARKPFASGCLVGNVLMTSAVLDDTQAGPTVLHFPISLPCDQVEIVPTWQTLGMRGTGSHDLRIEGVFVPASVVTVRRPRGRWHPALHLVAKVALPLIYAAYDGGAEAARELALREAQSRRTQPAVQLLAGELENALFTARLAHARMVELGAEAAPGLETTREMLAARTLLERAVLDVAEKAVELVGGRSFYRHLGLERLFRDLQAARFHPLPVKQQQELAGRLALGFGLDDAA